MLVLNGARGDVTHLAFSPNGKLLAASGGGRGMEMWDLPTANMWGRYTHNHHPTDGPIEFHPSRPICFATYNSCFVEVETDTKGARILTLDSPQMTFFRTTAMLPGGSGFVCRCDGNRHFDGVVRAMSWQAGRSLRLDWEAKFVGLSSRASRGLPPLLIRPVADNETFLTLDGKYGQDVYDPNLDLLRVSVWSVRRGTLLRSAKLPAGTALMLAVAPDGETFVTCQSHALSVWYGEDLTVDLRRIRNDTRSRFTAVAFHPSGRYLAATSNDATVKLYDTTTWEVARTFTWDIGRMRSIAFSPDGTLAAAGSDAGKVVVWDVDI